MSTPLPIKFGTDGWRGVIADVFTFENVRIVAQAICDVVRDSPKADKGLVIGHDNRFQGEHFARLVAEVCAGNGLPVCIGECPLPTPMVSFATKHYGLAGGIMITASHNPPEYSGVKFKTPAGASADPAITSQFEARVRATPVRSVPFDQIGDNDLLRERPLEQPYLDWVREFVHYDTLRKASYRVVVDSMYGVGKRYIEELLADTGHTVTTIRAERNPSFGGIAPEPVPKNMQAGFDAVKADDADVLLVTDGDADRLAAADNRGDYIITPKIAVLIAMHLMKNRGLNGSMVKTVSCSMVVDRFARANGLEVKEEPVGFKNIVPYLVSGEALIGTEESGGLGIQGHIPERDGILGSLMFVEALAGLGFANAGEAMDFLDAEFGTLRYHRIDKEIDPARKDSFLGRVEADPPAELLGRKVVNIKTSDGVKFECEDESWLLLRFSGTEPVVRFYAEAPTMEEAEALTEHGLAMLNA